jgi:predicted nucleic-acid-binding protein
VKKLIIDTNALISFVADRNPAQQANIANLLCSAAQLKVRLLCPQNVLTEFVYVMDSVYNIGKPEIKEIVTDFINLPGVEIVYQIGLKTLFAIWPEKVPDYGDAIIASLCKDTRNTSIVTFDKRFKARLKRLDLSVFSFHG